MLDKDMILGIDIGGSHITAALTKDYHELVPNTLVRHRVHSNGPSDEILAAWCTTIKEAWHGYGLVGSKIGIAMPGPFDYEAGISKMKNTDKYEALYAMNVRLALAERLNIKPSSIIFRNDAEAFLLGEMMIGAGKEYNCGIGVTLGTGLGSAVHRNGRTTDADRWCLPMENGIAEEYISTRFITTRYEVLTGTTVKDAQAVATRTDQDGDARLVFKEFSQHLAHFLKDFVRDEQPEVVVIGGNIAKAWPIIYPQLQESMQEEMKRIAVKQAFLGEEAALIGAACSWL